MLVALFFAFVYFPSSVHTTVYSKSLKASKLEFDESYLATQMGKLMCCDRLRISTI